VRGGTPWQQTTGAWVGSPENAAMHVCVRESARAGRYHGSHHARPSSPNSESNRECPVPRQPSNCTRCLPAPSKRQTGVLISSTRHRFSFESTNSLFRQCRQPTARQCALGGADSGHLHPAAAGQKSQQSVKELHGDRAQRRGRRRCGALKVWSATALPARSALSSTSRARRDQISNGCHQIGTGDGGACWSIPSLATFRNQYDTRAHKMVLMTHRTEPVTGI